MVGRQVLALVIGVRVPTSEQKEAGLCAGFYLTFLFKYIILITNIGLLQVINVVKGVLRKKIRFLIIQSDDNKIKGKFFKSETFLKEITFDDVFDTVLYYASIQQDVAKFSKIKSIDFYRLCKEIWKEWISEEKNGKNFGNLNSAWVNNSGPMGGTAGEAEIYFYYHPGVMMYETLFDFFSVNFNADDSYEWLRIETNVFPKWKRNLKKINLAFDLAYLICEAMRKKSVGR